MSRLLLSRKQLRDGTGVAHGAVGDFFDHGWSVAQADSGVVSSSPISGDAPGEDVVARLANTLERTEQLG